LPDDTVIDGEVVALDADGSLLSTCCRIYGSAAVPLHCFVFDLLVLNAGDVMVEPLVTSVTANPDPPKPSVAWIGGSFNHPFPARAVVDHGATLLGMTSFRSRVYLFAMAKIDRHVLREHI
jgi:hypothetical protein